MEIFSTLADMAAIFSGVVAAVTVHGWVQGFVLSPTRPKAEVTREAIAVITFVGTMVFVWFLTSHEEKILDSEAGGYILFFVLGQLMCLTGFVVDFYRRHGRW